MPLKTNSSHVLLTLGALFLIGAATRFLPERLAEAEDAVEEVDVPLVLSDDEPQAFDAPKSQPDSKQVEASCFSLEMAETLQADRDLLETELSNLNDEKLALENWENELTARTNELQALQQSMENRWTEMQAVAQQDIQHLVKMYAAMKPTQAAEIFDKFDPKFAAGFLRGMKSDQAGLIVANMDPTKAYQVSLELAAINEDLRDKTTP